VNKYLKPSKSGPREYFLVTGVTGLLGNYLLKDLLLRGKKLAVLARGNKYASAEQRIEEVMRRWESHLKRSLPRPVVLTGDVCEANFGLSDQELNWALTHCDQILHSAAVLQFNGYGINEEPWRTNFGGTRNALKLAEDCGIEHFQYVSTAYVCGKRAGRVLESELDCGQQFRNEYEKSKFESEKLIRQAGHLKTVTVYRPAVIVGDSQTGFTTTFHGLFLYLRLIATLVPTQKRNQQGIIETPIRLPMDGDEPRNLVPVDWVSQVIASLVDQPGAEGQTFHLSPDHCLTARHVIEYCYEYFNSCGVEFAGPQADRVPNSDFAARFFENSTIYQSYETSDPQFDTTNLKKFAGQIACPRIDKEMIHRFIEFGQANRWGKLRPKLPVLTDDQRSQLSKLEVPVGR
jgi:thioester reductase-like protein